MSQDVDRRTRRRAGQGALLMQQPDSAELGRLIEAVGLNRDRAAFARLSHKMPVACRFVGRRPTI